MFYSLPTEMKTKLADIKVVESTLVKYFREPNLFPKHKQSYDWRIQTFSTLCQRLCLRLGPVFENYINYIYDNGFDILFLYQMLIYAKRYNRATHDAVVNYARQERQTNRYKQETDNNRIQLHVDVEHYAFV